MNNRGFTLVELLATLVVLGIISAISYVSINGVIEKNKESNCEVLKNNIISAAKLYVSDNRYIIKEDFSLNPSISKLITDDYLKWDDIDCSAEIDDEKSIECNILINIELDDKRNVTNVEIPSDICKKNSK